MSYILEALKKSQQERELGHVPTLETPSFPSEEGTERPSLWVLSAVVLAALAVAIALYSTLRGSPPAPEVGEAGAEQTSPAEATREIPPAAAPPPVAAVPGSDLFERQYPAAATSVPPPLDSGSPDSAVLIPAPVAVAPQQPAPPPIQEPVHEPVQAPVPEPASAPVSAQDPQIPQDLIADIEAFKQEVRESQPAETSVKEKKAFVEPRDLRLPKDVRQRMPEMVMSAHIYDKEPAKRFVLINGLKVREGEESLEEIKVEEILPDGAVLSFEGNRFFQRR